jgi:UDP-perosamine 4-acetyltransferase
VVASGVKSEIVVVGAGGHAKVCVELLRAMGEHVAYCIGGRNGAAACVGVPVLEGDEHLARLARDGYSKVFIAIGSNQLRERLATSAIAHGWRLVNAISPQAIISPSARLGHGIAIMAGAVVNAEASIADLAIINTGATIDHDCQIGEAVHIAPQCGLAGNVSIGRLSFLGVGCKVIPGVTVGEAVIVGAGSVLTRDIASNVTAVGVPARVIKESRENPS